MKGILEIKEKCTACMACYNICPQESICMIENEEGFILPEIDENLCSNCLLCEEVCPELNKSNEKPIKLIQKAYYGWHNNEDIRKKSSSGGAFTAFADHILKNNGIVFGAVYDSEKQMVLHKSTDECEPAAMRKSKYVQSYIGDSFKKVVTALDNNKRVLFVGTPCQIAGLKMLCDHQNLITCDFICHGVPSMKLLIDDLKLLEKKYDDKIISFDFRPKLKTWSFDYFSIYFKSGNRKNIPWSNDSYYKGFIDNLTLRKSCYQCRYSASQHIADITLADYWGYRRYDENIFDNRGLSLILANTDKGENLIKSIDKNMFIFNSIEWKFADYVFTKRDAAYYNQEKRDAFFEYYKKYGYKKAIKKYGLTPSFKTKLIKFGSKIKGKLRKKII